MNNPYCFLNLNKVIKDFDIILEKLRNRYNYKFYWNLNCDNFSSKTLYENICKYCKIVKPERVYHCKICKSCIRKLDHHCLIVNNCIGYENYKIFLNMLFYGNLSLMVICMGMIENLRLNISYNNVILIIYKNFW